MKLKQISLNLIDVPAVRVTAAYDEEHLQLLRESLKAMGTVQPIIVCQTGERYEIVDGLHRLEEARARGEDKLPAVVYEGSPQDTLLMNLVLNRVRGKTKASEMVAVIKSLWQEHQLSSDDIATRTGLTRDYIEKLQRISTAAPSVQEALDREIIGVGAAYEIARLPRTAQQDEMMAKYQVWRFSVKELREFVNEVLRMMEQAPAQAPSGVTPQIVTPPRYECEACHKDTPPRFLKAVQLCPDCFGAVWRLSEKPIIEGEKVADKPLGG